jgi:hypothetical protein
LAGKTPDKQDEDRQPRPAEHERIDEHGGQRSLIFDGAAAIMPGILQPKPRIIGIKERPCSPILCINLSMTKAGPYTGVLQNGDGDEKQEYVE